MKAIISTSSRIRYPKQIFVEDYSIIDDFCYISTKLKVGIGSHIASGCSIAGGEKYQVSIGDFCSLSSGVKIWCSSNDFVNDIVAILPPGLKDIGEITINGDVVIEDYCGIGSNSVIMPNNKIPEGTAIGALSFVPKNFSFKPWCVYSGTPIRLIKDRNKENVLKQAKLLRNHTKID